ncbi:MAG: M48 family metallopeptidase [Candidatus Caenarcaniphilales bacterium]|nr:M48 family metallopeptidase [Candidatus Caenarcaniphilales bacterium]
MKLNLKTKLIYLIIPILLLISASKAQEQGGNQSTYKTKLNLAAEQTKVQNMLNKFIKTIDEDIDDYKIQVVESPEINAYASLGNNIVIYTALIELLQNDTALAFVVAHELGHLEENHVWKSVARQSLSSLLSYYVFRESRVLHGVDRLHSLHYSRSKEKEADMFAVKLMNQLYCKQAGKLEFFQTMLERGESPKILEYISTHPLSSTRLAYLTKEIEADNCLI